MSRDRAAILSPDIAGPILVVCPSWVGDTVMATPVYRALREHLPAARLVALVRPGLEEILHGCAWFDEIVVARSSGVAGPWRSARSIRRTKAQAALLLPNSFSSALGVLLARIPIRLGYQRDGRSPLLTHRIEIAKQETPQSTVPYYSRLAREALALDAIDETVALACSADQRDAAERILPSAQVSGRLVVLNPGANRADKRWPAERFARVGDHLIESHGACIAVTGSPAERDVIDRMLAASRSGQFIDLAERGVTLGSLKAILERASLLITNDTGPRHIAIALNTPVVSLFGPTDYRWTRIDGAAERALLAEPFLPEQLIADQHANHCAIERIAASDVIHAARCLLDD